MIRKLEAIAKELHDLGTSISSLRREAIRDELLHHTHTYAQCALYCLACALRAHLQSRAADSRRTLLKCLNFRR